MKHRAKLTLTAMIAALALVACSNSSDADAGATVTGVAGNTVTQSDDSQGAAGAALGVFSQIVVE